ncbi:SDR family NAD(P)-dependent oxidoreductase [Streptomyces telluris]|uniref:SDR family NAD(P)-dependent oxidoreductase n=1 Tax=Streptomyces telluris TaxID=2720021 RepID=A0A9X2LI28_9ACTN|nr:SDR family NAD(P)-dependent oxidoreductase [Streptomyces telluris]MCQ8771891.1 SDR family NAD(P)-dependent oxidoreductase [Streptomyces telluris]NJP80039.1 SDR family NAD(P)-dependent oxidoreductase [Streptomyces telluris]
MAHAQDRADGLAGRSALVTGSSRGLGLLIARELARRGCRVMLCARDAEELSRAEAMLREEGVEARSLTCDLTDEATPGRLITAVRDAFGGGPDILVNNAGVIQVGPVSAMTESDFRQAMETMYFAPLRLVRAALPGMRESGGGRIVNVSSIGGRVAAPHLLPYVGAKFAAAGLSEGLRAELAADGISVTSVFPGLMRTGSHTAARFSGRPAKEYAWFAVAAGLPGLSMDAERAARAIVRATERRRPELVLTPAAKAAVRLHGLAPATVTRCLTLGARLLPTAGGAPQHNVPGREAARTARPGVIHRLTRLNDRAARRFNQQAG